ncbi:MAG: hypothetical protein P4L40_05270 [Terracidiphilus sp.]|nr:hypothetical protein [Terracidiphilus sp.]
MAAGKKRLGSLVKVTDEAIIVRCVAGDGLIREEMWEDEQGNAVRYNLAFINFHLFPRDNGRVLGYDTAHGQLHRHFAGAVEVVESAPFRVILARFMSELDELKRRRKL